MNRIDHVVLSHTCSVELIYNIHIDVGTSYLIICPPYVGRFENKIDSSILGQNVILE